ncbi:MAG: tetratricopeptide repeat protein [Bacteroidetes bacterium]|nr:tetratricopeptide repeat protein [Fibrella sp.]
MIQLFLSVLVWVWSHRSFDDISRNNLARKDAEAAYQAGNYERAAERYTYLTRLGPLPEPALLLNLGHCHFRLNQYSRARPHYEKLRQVGNPDLSAMAAVQLGVIACQEKDSATALTLFQQAMLQNPDSEPARYNFELIKKLFSGQPLATQSGRKAKPKTASGRQPSAADQLKLTQAQTLTRSAQQNDKLNRFRNLAMTEAQARQILEAMQGNDLPYSLARHRGKTDESESGNKW